MSINDQINQIEALRDKAISGFERASALAEKHRKEADDFNIAIDVLSKIAPLDSRPATTTHSRNIFPSGKAPHSAVSAAVPPIYQRILTLLQQSEQTWWTANQIQEALEARGDVIKMTSISPNLSRLKDSNDIVRDDLKVALAARVSQNTEAPEDDLLSGNSSGASIDHDLTNRGTQQSSLVKPLAGGGP
jgi:hypothetical protein